MKRRTRCRSCHSEKLVLCHDFGEQPLAGQFPRSPQSQLPAAKFPLDLSQCQACGLLQVTWLPDIDDIFHADYRYSTSTVPALVQHFDHLSDWFSQHYPHRQYPKVLEFGCNDGALLSFMKARGYTCTGVDASDNVATLARRKGIDVHTSFFTSDLIQSKAWTDQFDLITCSNVYAHTDALDDITKAAWSALRTGGIFCVEVHDGDLIGAENQFDTIYHEHLTYFSAYTLQQHLMRHGFEIVETLRTDMHGGGLRVIASKSQLPNVATPSSLDSQTVLWLESSITASITKAQQDLNALLAKHGQLWAYGAAGRSQMFINFLNAGEHFHCVYDDSPLRQGRFIVGTDIPVKPFSSQTHTGAVVILAWNYAPSIVPRIQGKFDAIYTLLPDLKRWD
jgi:SAM-dependent methyltransferase